MHVAEKVRALVDDVLLLGGRTRHWSEATPLLGAVPEFDSMAVVGLVTAIEEDFGVVIADEDLTASNFATLGSLTRFVQDKISESRFSEPSRSF